MWSVVGWCFTLQVFGVKVQTLHFDSTDAAICPEGVTYRPVVLREVTRQEVIRQEVTRREVTRQEVTRQEVPVV